MKECSIVYKGIKAFLTIAAWDFTLQHFKIGNQKKKGKKNQCPKAGLYFFFFFFLDTSLT